LANSLTLLHRSVRSFESARMTTASISGEIPGVRLPGSIGSVVNVSFISVK